MTELFSEVQKIKQDHRLIEALQCNLAPYVADILFTSDEKCPDHEFNKAVKELVEFIRQEKIISAERAIRFYKKSITGR